MECKFACCDYNIKMCFRINRYIMECKLKIEDRQAVVHKRINRYIMECKFIVGSKLDNIDPKELIDTLWNVNNKT